MSLVYKSQFYNVEVPKLILVDRDDGGHIEIHPKIKVCNRQDLSPEQSIELARLTSVVGQALDTVMNEKGVDIGRINYQDNGNWDVFSKNGPHLHIHIFGRAKSAKWNVYGKALYFPRVEEKLEYYKNFKPLNADDILSIRKEINRLFTCDEYKNSVWGL